MQGLNALIVHSTHIQFLTMLFPSTLEVNLILGLLGEPPLLSSPLTRKSDRLTRNCSVRQVRSLCRLSHSVSRPCLRSLPSTISGTPSGTRQTRP